MIQRERDKKSEGGRQKEMMPGGRERRRQRLKKKEGWGVARESRCKEWKDEQAKGERLMGNKVAEEKRKP